MAIVVEWVEQETVQPVLQATPMFWIVLAAIIILASLFYYFVMRDR